MQLIAIPFAIILCSCSPMKAQFVDPHEFSEEYGRIFETYEVDITPKFPGGKRAMIDFLNEEVVYPLEALEQAIEGELLISFVVAPDGSIIQDEILKSLGFGCEEEVLSVLKEMPRWRSGVIDNVRVATRVQLSIVFRLNI